MDGNFYIDKEEQYTTPCIQQARMKMTMHMMKKITEKENETSSDVDMKRANW